MKKKLFFSILLLTIADIFINTFLILSIIKENFLGKNLSAPVRIELEKLFGGIGKTALYINVIVIAISIIIIISFLNWILRPLYEDGSLKNIKKRGMGEILPIEKAILDREEKNKLEREKLLKERSHITLILENMGEGIVILDQNKKILIVNNAAKRLLNIPVSNDYIGKNHFTISRDNQYVDCIEMAYKNESQSGIIKTGNKILRLFTTPVCEKDNLMAVFCLISDQTDQYEKEKLRSEFTANVSHELKTPLTSILGYADLIAQGFVEEKDVEKFASKIADQSKILLSMINDIIKLSEIDMVASITKSRFNFTSVIKTSISRMEIIIEEKGIELIQKINQDIYITGNESMISDLANNLISNAIRYNKENGKIFVSLYEEKDFVIFEVEDTGIGIPDEHKERIFERFYTVDESRSKEIGGTGLGLSIVKHVALAHDAKIKLDSSEGKGSKFTIYFNKH